ncbi:MAG TPA: hypothetical protein VKE88_03125, partial [Candidatus Nanoarchaeia archaeon]|nr:hypothetical protein [Candidatus Nanoarchaeia archaeon]
INNQNILAFYSTFVNVSDVDNLFVNNSIVAVNSSAEPNMNVSANVSFIVNSCTDSLFENTGFFRTPSAASSSGAVACTSCQSITCANNVMNFTVTEWSSIFSAAQPASPPSAGSGATTSHSSYSPLLAQYTCGDFSVCINGVQTRTCTDAAGYYKQKTETQVCTSQPIQEQPLPPATDGTPSQPSAPAETPSAAFTLPFDLKDVLVGAAMIGALALVISSLVAVERFGIRKRLFNDYDVKATENIINKVKAAPDHKVAVHIYNDAVRAYQGLTPDKKKLFENDLKELHRKLIK